MTHAKISSSLLLLLLAIFLLNASTACAGGIKERMLERLPVLNELKASGIIGENNNGYLEFRQSSSSHQGILAQENDDREKVYSAIAQKTGATIESVGQRRSVQISEIADPGTWVQNPSGQWIKK